MGLIYIKKIGKTILHIIILCLSILFTIVLFLYPPFIIGFIFSLIIGFLGLDFYDSRVDKFQLWVSKKYNLYTTDYNGLDDDKWYSKYPLVLVSSIANRCFQLADKIQNSKTRAAIKSGLIFYLTIIFSFVSFIIIVWILEIYLILWLIGSAFSGGSSGGSTSGNSGGSSSGGSDPFDINKLDTNWLDPSRQYIQNKNGKVVGELDSDYFLFDDNKAIKDENGNLVGHIEINSFGDRIIKKY